jgi:hypothetical protein
MRPFHDWLDRVLTDGESVLEAPPRLASDERPAVEARLRAAYDLDALDVAGPPLAFDPAVAGRAAHALACACWALVGLEADEPDVVLAPVRAPAAHLSADVTLRFAPDVYRRARVRDPNSPLATALDRLLRAWPLSGVLADLDGTPTTEPDFGHPGLQLLYAERLAAARRSGWVPAGGAAREWAERVFAERGLTLPEPLKETAGD